MKNISIYLVTSLLVITGILGLGIGYYFTQQYQLSMYDKNIMDLGRADRWLDLRYLNAMIAHHRGAMLLAQKAGENSQRVEIKNLAAEILKNEPVAIAELYQWKKDWYNDSKVVRDPVVAKLGNYDEKFDLRFLNALVAHHEAGILMVQDVRVKSARAEVLNNADVVDKFLVETLKIFKDWRKEWYKI